MRPARFYRSAGAILFALLLFVSTAIPQVTRPSIRWISTLPAVCNPNRADQALVYKYTATTGLYRCSATNTWTAVGGSSFAIGTSITSATEGSVFYAGASGVLAQDNPDFFYDAANNRLQVGKTNTGYLQFGSDFGTIGKRIYSPNDGNNILIIGVPAQLRFTDANGNNTWSILPTSDFALNRTITAGGSTGAVTINLPAGTVNFAAGTSSLVVTNSLVTANSLVYAVVRTNDATALIKNVVPAAGSFTIRLNANATAETSVGFWVTN